MNIALSLAAALAAGLLLSRVVKRVGLPNVTGYLIAGLLIGPSCLNLLPARFDAVMAEIITVALGFIAFSIGVEFKLSNLKAIGTRSVTITLFQALTALALVDIVLIVAGFDLPMALTLGAIATATAPAATLMVVRQYKAKGPVTSTLLPVVAMDDAVGLIAFSVSIALAQSFASSADLSLMSIIGSPLIEIALSLLIGSALGLLVAFTMRFFHSRNNFVMIAMAAVLLGIGISERYGLSSLLLCMSIGAVFINLYEKAEPILEACDRWTPPLFLLFFVFSGAELDLSAIPGVGLLGVLYLLARSIGKYLGTFVGSQIVGADRHVRNYLGLALLPQAGVAIGMSQLASVALPQYAAQIRTVVLCATLVYELVGPVVTKIALTRAGEIPTARTSPAAQS